jgi:H+/Cl- antiporter ClcA
MIDMQAHTFHWKTMLSVFTTFLPLMALTYGSATPMGIFMPSIVIG